MILRLILLAVAFAAATVASAENRPPHLIFFLADDLRWNALGHMSGGVVKTPHIDALAARGTAFQNAFVTTSICCVSRASILSGQNTRRHGIGDFKTPFTADRWKNTYPMKLRAAGYRTGFIGKFGVGDGASLPKADFDYWDGFPGQGLFFPPKADPATARHLTARMGDSALKFIGEADDSKPICLSLSFKAVHAQDGAPREFPPDARDASLYDDITLVPGPLVNEEAFGKLPIFLQKSEARRRAERRFVGADLWQKTTRDYYRLATGMDREIGRILDRLREKGWLERCVVVFSSDNGFYLGDRGLSDKWFMHEESIRVPLIVADYRSPSAEGRKPVEMALNSDIAPTLLDYAGVEIPAGMQGRSLRPFVEGRKAGGWRHEWFYEHKFTNGGSIPDTEGVRSETWSYVRYTSVNPGGDPPEELFDLKADPLQLKNLVGDAASAPLLNEAREAWKRLGSQ